VIVNLAGNPFSINHFNMAVRVLSRTLRHGARDRDCAIANMAQRPASGYRASRQGKSDNLTTSRLFSHWCPSCNNGMPSNSEHRTIGGGKRRKQSTTSKADVPNSILVEEKQMMVPDAGANINLEEHFADLLLPYFSEQRPLLIRGGAMHHRAAQVWPSTWSDYFVEQVGYDTLCTVEIGSNYDNGAMQSTIAFGDYVQYVRLAAEQQDGDESHNLETVYLAQQDIYSELLKDISLPHAISAGVTQNIDNKRPTHPTTPKLIGHGKLYSTMMWFGPAGCVTPLHFDPMDNMFFQYVGRKRVLLYPPQNDDKNPDYENVYYAGDGLSSQYNTSAVNVEVPDLQQFPNFANAPPAFLAEVAPGDVLFIPKRWWHHVRSLDTSVSVNAWFR
jgi:hypothetical protein